MLTSHNIYCKIILAMNNLNSDLDYQISKDVYRNQLQIQIASRFFYTFNLGDLKKFEKQYHEFINNLIKRRFLVKEPLEVDEYI